jgi:hypothetical protein
MFRRRVIFCDSRDRRKPNIPQSPVISLSTFLQNPHPGNAVSDDKKVETVSQVFVVFVIFGAPMASTLASRKVRTALSPEGLRWLYSPGYQACGLL